MLRITTAGESHGKGMLAIIEGLPAGLQIDMEEIDRQLALRQSGFGRGARQKIERDHAELLAGVRDCRTLGSPVAILVRNEDYKNWAPYMAPEGCDLQTRRLTRVRPGHADLAGAIKFGTEDARDVLERASARETAARVAAGAICRMLLSACGISLCSYVRAIGTVCDEREYSFAEITGQKRPLLGMMREDTEQRAVDLILRTQQEGDTLGGVIELRAAGVKSGFGSCMTARERLDARLVGALMSVQAIKGAEIGLGFAAAALPGSRVHDEIFYSDARAFYRTSNRAGGIEGGMSNGEELILRAAMKPLPTLGRGLQSVDLLSHERVRAAAERSDVCAVTACAVVLEHVLASELAAVLLERLGGGRLDEVVDRYRRLP